MMKRKFLAVVLPIIGCATVVGSGFSAWYFDEGVAYGEGGSTSTNVNVTEEIKASTGNLDIVLKGTSIDGKKDTLVLDQGGARNNSVNSGIMFGDENSTVTKKTEDKAWAFTVTYYATKGGGSQANPLTIDELYASGLRIRIEMKVTIGTTLYKYIDYQNKLPGFDVAASVGDLGTSPTTATFEKREQNVITADYIVNADALEEDGLEKLSLDFELDLDTIENPITDKESSEGTRIDYSNSLFVYKENKVVENEYEGGKPESSGQLTKMKGEVASDSVTFSVIAHIEDDPTK